MRHAIYYAPPPGSVLHDLGSRWLGRDAVGGTAITPVAAPDLDLHALTAEARRYGFHATLKAPFRLAAEMTEMALLDAVAALAATAAPVTFDAHVATLGGFIAIVPQARPDHIGRLAGDIVARLDRFRAPLTAAERARRRPQSLSPAEVSNLDTWGYPHVMDAFRFHMTLSARLPDPWALALAGVAARHFAPCLPGPVSVDAVSVFVEPAPGQPFRECARFALTGDAP